MDEGSLLIDSFEWEIDELEACLGVGEIAIGQLEVPVMLTPERLSRIEVELQSPEGTGVELFNGQVVPSARGGLALTFNDQGIAVAPESLTCRCLTAPTGVGGLAEFEGEDPAGIWEMILVSYAYSQTIVLEEWCIFVFPDELPAALADRYFLRGDVNGNGEVSALADAQSLLKWAFLDGEEPPCLDAADVNDNGRIDLLTDAIVLLAWAFSDGESQPAPGTKECGVDPGGGDLGCIWESAFCDVDCD